MEFITCPFKIQYFSVLFREEKALRRIEVENRNRFLRHGFLRQPDGQYARRFETWGDVHLHARWGHAQNVREKSRSFPPAWENYQMTTVAS